jgi:hypothetical protein
MDGLIEGRIVHFVMPNGQHRPAIVVQVWRVPDSPGPEPILKAPENGCCNLRVFTDGPNDVPYTPEEKEKLGNWGFREDDVRHGHIWATSMMYSEEPKPGTWHWIEHA